MSQLKMSKRHYHFELPYEMSGFYASMAVSELQQMGLWDKIPLRLRNKLLECGFFDSMEITKADCDALPDDVFAKIAERLDLEWSPA